MTAPLKFQPGTGPRKMLCYAREYSLDDIRFWSRVNRDKECWEWMAVKSHGYGTFHSNKGRRIASRYSWEFTHGSIPDGLFVLHRCDNRACVNPSHLFLGTHQDNMRDMVSKGRQRNGVVLGEDHPNSRLRADQVVVIRRRLEAGESQRWLAKEYGVSKPTIARAAFGITWKHVSNPCPAGSGQAPTQSKLTPDQVHDIRRRFDNGESVSHLARGFGVSWTTADRVGRRLDWRHLPEADY